MELSKLRLNFIVVVLLLLNSCTSQAVRQPNPIGPYGQVLFDRLFAMQDGIGWPPYAGISFNGYDAYLGNLTVFVIGEHNRQRVRNEIIEVFGQQNELVTIEVWDNAKTIADESLKGDVSSVALDVDDTITFVDYDEHIDRVSIGLQRVEAVTKYETAILSQLSTPREALSIKLAERPQLLSPETSSSH